MSKVTGFEPVYSMRARGAWAFPGGFGLARHGMTRYGFYHRMAGIYQKRIFNKKSVVERMVFYRPRNPQTAKQQAWRAVLTAGWAAYAALTTEEKRILLVQSANLRMSGANLYMRRWLLQHVVVPVPVSRARVWFGSLSFIGDTFRGL